MLRQRQSQYSLQACIRRIGTGGKDVDVFCLVVLFFFGLGVPGPQDAIYPEPLHLQNLFLAEVCEVERPLELAVELSGEVCSDENGREEGRRVYD